MKAPQTLPEHHRRTYDLIFKHPAPHNLEWRAVRAMLSALCRIEEKPNGDLRITRNGRVLVLPTPRTKEISDIEDLHRLRDFLETAEANAPKPDESAANGRWVLVIDHERACIFQSDRHGARPRVVTPPPLENHFRHTLDDVDFSHAKEPHGQSLFFSRVADELKEADHILILGAGTGHGNEPQQFIAWTNVHRPELAAKIAAAIAMDDHHLTHDQLLAEAREFFAGAKLS